MPNSAMRNTFERIIINQFTPLHCAQARELLGWSLEQLSDKSKVSVPAIQRFEASERVRDVTLLALAYSLEAEGLVFFPGFAPSWASNFRGTTPDPMGREDFALIE
ncbi:helix-turn-helix domain-containing protein [Pseudomonas sp. FSL R10-1350]|jgi:transcriptional regulator with XRE-family HTH domain|uniref:Helix-turn-helix domain-containing protein n=1 Tax=Pseudomonas helleri TaxID=1608996 RepID=A0A0J6IEZ6_9PSED|nr:MULTISPECIES: helix-turn-helix transcriptional regulator [Pseudomonas]MDU7559132.1 helix-turn-helix transcriptional regulator [Pseudomonas sp.]KMN10254.1 XRE family transcriptional regulator [Pseudomonas helleri]KMN24648.1 XRE family transcriptional regulator [Pseudomonas helleri]MCU1755446.1 helix-turn-helix transcriptional regulator [Pseudomonas helleri]MQT30574.1 helix-turn-helix domain-containing protein [Pseudomonas helleri]